MKKVSFGFDKIQLQDIEQPSSNVSLIKEDKKSNDEAIFPNEKVLNGDKKNLLNLGINNSLFMNGNSRLMKSNSLNLVKDEVKLPQNFSIRSEKSKDEKLNTSSSSSELGDSYSEEEKSSNSNESDGFPKTNKWEKAYFLANLSLHFENYSEGIKYSDEMVCLCDDNLNNDQVRVFLGINFGFINEFRNSQRMLLDLIMTSNKGKKMLQEIKEDKERKILRRCERVLKLINEHILNKKIDNIGLARMYKVKADFYRYMAEITTGTTLYQNKQSAFLYYNKSKELTKDFDDLNPIKLNLSLNYSVFLNEILNKRINSYFCAKEALFNALKALKNCKEEELTSEGMRDTLMIIESLNTNVEDWYKEEVGDIFEQEKNKKNEEKNKNNDKEKFKKLELNDDDIQKEEINNNENYDEDIKNEQNQKINNSNTKSNSKSIINKIYSNSGIMNKNLNFSPIKENQAKPNKSIFFGDNNKKINE
jgi:14-3-3 protein epsilon